jgi:hypothetical protein
MLDATPLLKLYARRRLAKLAAMDVAAVQERQLLELVRHAAGTRFGQEHGFEKIHSVADFQKQVKLRRYENFWTEYWKNNFPDIGNITWPGRIEYFAISSGTTSGNTKYVPVSTEMMSANRRAVFDLLSFHVAAKPDTHILGGKNFMLGGSTQLKPQADGIYSGDLSGIAAKRVPWWAKARYFPGPDLARIADWDEKVDRLAPMSLKEDIRMLGGTASWMLAFIEHVLSLKPGAKKISDIYPKLDLLVHGGVNFAPYKRRFDALLEGSKAETREVYPASEGFIAVADRGPGEGLRLIPDNGLFFEFVPLEELDAAEPTRHWVATIETDVNYALVLSSCAGLWSYVLGDTVRFVDREKPRLLVTGRTSYFLSAFGEHLIGEEIELALEKTAQALSLHLIDYSVGALYPKSPTEKGRHLFIIEFKEKIYLTLIEQFKVKLDEHLAAANLDYKEHRLHDFQMAMPWIMPVKEGTFAAWMKQRGKLGAQNKVPRVINDEALFENLKRFAEENKIPL